MVGRLFEKIKVGIFLKLINGGLFLQFLNQSRFSPLLVCPPHHKLNDCLENLN